MIVIDGSCSSNTNGVVQPQTNTLRFKNDAVAVAPINRLSGELRVPGDKSISHRAAMLSSLACGDSVLQNFSSAQDCEATLECFRTLGVHVVRDNSTVVIRGAGPSGLQEPPHVLDAQNSGTTMRLLAGILAGQPFPTTITGDDSLRTRPMLRVADPLRLMGAQVEVEANGCAPLRINGRRPLQPIHYRLPIASAQIKSAVLLAGLAADGITTVEEPAQTRDHTERMLQEFGALVERNGDALSVQGGVTLRSRSLVVPGDNGAQLSSFGDHRIAMASAVAALVAEGPSEIEGARNSVAVSLPEFWTLLESVAE